MLQGISAYYPVIERATANFNKTQSQFMNNMLTVNHPTELRNARQILVEIERSRMALDEAFFGIQKKRLEIRRKEAESGKLALDVISRNSWRSRLPN